MIVEMDTRLLLFAEVHTAAQKMDEAWQVDPRDVMQHLHVVYITIHKIAASKVLETSIVHHSFIDVP